MTYSPTSLERASSTLRGAGPMVWVWMTLFAVVLLSGGALCLSDYQRHVAYNLTGEVGALRTARIDLAKGYLSVVSAGSSTAPFDRDAGLALVEQAGAAFEHTLKQQRAYEIARSKAYLADAVQASLAYFVHLLHQRHDAASEPGSGGNLPDTAMTVKLRNAFYALERDLDALDIQMSQEILRMQRHHDANNVWFVCGALLVLTMSSGVIFANGRARRRAEREIEAARQYVSNIIDTIGDPVFVKDEQHHFVLVNQAECAIVGHTREELIGKTDADFFPAEQARVFWETDDQVLATGQENVNEEVLTDTRTQTVRAISTTKTRYEDSSGKRYVVGITRDVTARKNAESALRENLLRFRALFDNMREGFATFKVLFDEEGQVRDFVYLDVNASFNRLTGLEDVVGKRVTEVFPKIREMIPGFFETYGRIALSGQSEHFEIDFVPIAKWLDISVYSTGPGYFVTVFDDITERKQSEREREVTVQLLHALNASGDSRDLIRTVIVCLKDWTGCEAAGIRLRDGDDYPYFEVSGFPGHFLATENSLCAHDLNGQVLRDDVGNPILECMCGNILCGRIDPAKPFFTPYGSFWSNCTTQLLASTTEVDRQARTRNRCNGEGYESVALIPLRNDSTVLGLLQLNDKRKDRFTPGMIPLLERLANSIAKALGERLAREALRESEARFSQIAEQSREMIWEVNAEGRFLYVSRMAEGIYGYAPEEIMGGMHFYDLFPETGRDDFKSAVFAAFARKAPLELTHPMQTKSGAIIHISTKGMPIIRPDGVLLGYRGSDSDITARKRAEEERERLEEQLRQAQKMEAVGQLAGGIAHDFNNLLQVILGRLDILKQNELPPGATREQELEEIRIASERAAELTSQLLAFSRRQLIRPTTLDLNELIRGVLRMIRRVIGEHIELYFVSGEHLGAVCADKVQIEQVLMNLCVNARDAMGDGGTLTIETENVVVGEEYGRRHPWATLGRYALLSVTDTGHGMDEHTRVQIFDPFFTTKDVGQGTGLGLSTVYGIVRQHNGMIHVYSEPGMGTTFKIYLPLAERPAETVGTKTEARAVGGSETILVAEDEEMVRNLVVQMLRHAGYTVLAAQDGEEAIRVFEANRDGIDLALLDVMMPKLGGREVMSYIQQHNPRVRILFSSGYSENAVHTNFVLKEGLNLITKPYRRPDLLRALRRVLDQ